MDAGVGVGEDFERESPLAGCGSELVDGETLVDTFGAAEAVEAGGGEDESVGGAFTPFAEAGVDVAAQLDEAEVRAQREQHCLATWAGGADRRAGRKGVEAPEIFADEGVAGVGTRRDRSEREAGVDFGGEIFERVDCEVDAAVGEGFFDFLDEDAGAVGRETFRGSETRGPACGRLMCG